MTKQTEPENFNDVQVLLAYIQKNLKAPKSQFNKFGGYHYRNKEDILNAVKDLLFDGATITVNDELVLIGDRYYIKAEAVLTYGNESLSALGWARESQDKKGMDASQITGSTSSYAGKYALNNLFAIDDTKDADATNDHGAEEIDGLVNKVKEVVTSGDWAEASRLESSVEDIDTWRSAWSKLDSHKKGQFNKLMDKRNEYRDIVNDYAYKEDADGVHQLWDELSENEKVQVWRCLSEDTKAYMKSIKQEEAA